MSGPKKGKYVFVVVLVVLVVAGDHRHFPKITRMDKKGQEEWTRMDKN